jgi:isopenicillin-N epimerase
VLVDGAHVPGLFAEPLHGVDADFWVGNLHKFACAPRGTAALVAAGPHTRDLYPLVDSWGAELAYPERFDHQGTDDFTSYLATPVVLETIEQRYGWDAVRTYARSLADHAQAAVGDALGEACGEDLSVEVGTPAPTMRLVALPGGLAGTPEDAHGLRQSIAAKLGIETAITSWRGRGFLRLSSHVYNVADDYDQLVERAVPFIVEQAGAAHG